MTNVGYTTMQVIPSLRGLQAELRSQLGEVDTAGASAGRSLGGAISAAASRAFVGVSTAIVGVGTAVAGLAIGGGINRALAIEGAQAKLKGLGHDAASVSQIMANALASVKGTAFGLGDAASVAAGMVAAGVKQGAQLEQTLKTVADVATISGRGMTDIGLIFQSVAARGKLQGDDMLQLMSSGVPVLQLLGQRLGKTSAEVSDMVSKGKIDFATFEAAMRAGMGGAALASGQTFTGALANVKAALSRLGEPAATAGLAILKGVFNDITPAIDKLTARLSPMVTALASQVAPVVDRISKGVSGFISGADFGKIGSQLSGLAPVLGPLAGVVAALGGANLAGMLGPLGALIPTLSGPMGAVVGLVGTLIAQSPALRSGLGAVFSQLGTAAAGMVPMLTQLMGAVSGVAVQIGDALGGALSAIAPALGQALGQVGPVLGQLVSAVVPIIGQVGSIAAEAIGLLGPAVGQVVTALVPVVSALVPALQPVLGVLASALPQLAPAINALIPLMVAMANLLGTVLPPILRVLTPIIEGLAWVISGVLGGALKATAGELTIWTQLLSGDFSGAWDTFTGSAKRAGESIAAAIKPGLQSTSGSISAWAGGIAQSVQGAWSGLVSGVQQWWTGVVDAVRNGVSQVSVFLTQLPAMAAKVMADLGAAVLTGIGYAIGAVIMLPTVINTYATLAATWLRDRTVEGFTAMVSAVQSGIAAAVAFIAALPGQVLAFMQQTASWLGSKAIEGATALVAAIRSGIDQAVGFVLGLPGRIVVGVQGLASMLASGAMAAATALVTGIRVGIDQAVGIVTTLPGRVLDVLYSLAGRAYDAAMSIGQRIADGLRAAIGRIASAAQDAMAAIAAFLPHSPAERGPFRAWGGWGEAIVDQFAGELAAGAPLAAAATAQLMGAVDLTRALPAGALDTPASSAGGVAGAVLAALSRMTVYVQNPWTGEQVRAHVVGVVDGLATDAGEELLVPIVSSPGVSWPVQTGPTVSGDGRLVAYLRPPGVLVKVVIDGAQSVRVLRDGAPVLSGDPVHAVAGHGWVYDPTAPFGADVTYTAVATMGDGSTVTSSVSVVTAQPLTEHSQASFTSLAGAFLVRQGVEKYPDLGTTTPNSLVEVPGSPVRAGSWQTPVVDQITAPLLCLGAAERDELLAMQGPQLMRCTPALELPDGWVLPVSSKAVRSGLDLWVVTLALAPIGDPPTIDSPLIVPGHSWDDARALYGTWDGLRTTTWDGLVAG